MQVKEFSVKNCKDVLPNGLTVVTVEMPHLHTVEVSMFVRAGLRFENEKNNGISHFLEHMMFRGNRKYADSISLNMEFEKIGRDLRASTLGEYTQYGFNPHISELGKGMEIFSEFFYSPTFPEIEVERGIILEEYYEDLNEDGVNVDINNHACKLLYPGTPMSWPTIGTEETIKNMSVEMLRGYYNAHYIPGNMVLAMAGPIEHEHNHQLAENYFFNLEDYKFAQIGHNTALRFLTHLRKNPDFNQEYTSFEEKIDGIDLQGLFAKTPNEDMPNPFSALHPEIWKITQIAHQDKQHMTIFSRYGIDEDSQRQHPRRIR